MSKDIAIIAGDGIGKEVIDVALECLSLLEDKFQFKLERQKFPFGGEHYLKTKETLSAESLEELKKYKTIFLGAIGVPDKIPPGILERELLLKIRFECDQYINLRPVKLYQGVESPIKLNEKNKIDYIVVRENTAGLYSGTGGITGAGTPHAVAVQSMVYTQSHIQRVLEYTFEYALKNNRKKVTLVGKSNVLTHVFKLWLDVLDQVAEQYPTIQTDYVHVDAVCIRMVTQPELCDVLVTTNMFGDIITDLAAVTQGGIGLASSANINPNRVLPSMFEPVHGSAPDIVGQNKANPIATILSLKDLLLFLNHKQPAECLEASVSSVFKEYGSLNDRSTSQILDDICKQIKSN